MTRSSLIAPFVVILALGCDKDPPPDAEGAAKKEEKLPDIKVELPPSPNFEEAKAPEKWEDGTYSVFGLRQKIDERVKEGDAGTEIEIKGFVQEIYEPPVCPEGQVCPPGKQPHFWITDKVDQEGKKRAMMVVNYRYVIPEWEMENWKDIPTVIVEKTKPVHIKGIFKRFSDTGFAHDNGLIEFRAYKAANPETGVVDWVYPPYAPYHPKTVQLQEEENLRMQQKMAEDALKYKGQPMPGEKPKSGG